MSKSLLISNELGKRGVGFILITRYSTSIPPEARNIGTYFIMAAMRRIKKTKGFVNPRQRLVTIVLGIFMSALIIYFLMQELNLLVFVEGALCL